MQWFTRVVHTHPQSFQRRQKYQLGHSRHLTAGFAKPSTLTSPRAQVLSVCSLFPQTRTCASKTLLPRAASPCPPHGKLRDSLLTAKGRAPKRTKQANLAPPRRSRPTACGAGLLQLRRDALHPPHSHSATQEPRRAGTRRRSVAAPPRRGRRSRSAAADERGRARRGGAESGRAPPQRQRQHLPRHPRRRGAGRGTAGRPPAEAASQPLPCREKGGVQPRFPALPDWSPSTRGGAGVAPWAACLSVSSGPRQQPRPGLTRERRQP